VAGGPESRGVHGSWGSSTSLRPSCTWPWQPVAARPAPTSRRRSPRVPPCWPTSGPPRAPLGRSRSSTRVGQTPPGRFGRPRRPPVRGRLLCTLEACRAAAVPPPIRRPGGPGHGRRLDPRRAVRNDCRQRLPRADPGVDQSDIPRQGPAQARAAEAMVVGITGSYGKTSTKYFTEALLESRFRVLKTRASFNTILGVCRAITRSSDRSISADRRDGRLPAWRDPRHGPPHQAHIGVLTAIGPQHLERFGSIETIEKAKFELLEALAPDGSPSSTTTTRASAGWRRASRCRRYSVTALTLPMMSWTSPPNRSHTSGRAQLHARRAIRRASDRQDPPHRDPQRQQHPRRGNGCPAAGVSLREVAGAIGRLQPVPTGSRPTPAPTA